MRIFVYGQNEQVVFKNRARYFGFVIAVYRKMPLDVAKASTRNECCGKLESCLCQLNRNGKSLSEYAVSSRSKF